ncbi:MAG: exodeoxyribonuclease V subunit beta [Thiohalomonadaceae bacterium]
MQELQIETFPLTGQRLIEASAGTGKTYTIAELYLRLLLEKELTVTQILVVTFTEAATQELRGRVRLRLYNALRFVSKKSDEDNSAAMLSQYRGDLATIQRLQDAVTRMDEAAIFTIHGFCQRSLTDNAFESGVLFDAAFVTDETSIREDIAKDFWRKRVIPADAAAMTFVIENWQNPSALLRAVSPLVGVLDIKIIPVVNVDVVAELTRRYQSAFAELRAAWLHEQTDIISLLESSDVLSRAEKAYRQDKLDEVFAGMAEFAKWEHAPASLPPLFDLLTESKINDASLHKKAALKKGIPIPAHPLFALADKLARIHSSLNTARLTLFMQEAADYISSELAQRKDKSRIMFFDDLLNKLDIALMGDGGEELATRIRQRYPVAMIDEFQDTDPIQYRIFNSIYQQQDECGLFLIGDPKQAIYSFRGADIFTYMQARADTDADTGHYTLKTNYRSHSALVKSVNAVFGNARAPFVYAGEIDFMPVKAAAKADSTPLSIEGQLADPLVCWYLQCAEENSDKKSKKISKQSATTRIAEGCAAEIARLLSLGQRGKASIGERNLQARDIAVLVRDRYEAAHIRQALAKCGVASVYISRDSVFQTDEARDLAHLLRAVAEPERATLLRTAMATNLLGYSANEIYAFNADESAWNEKVLAFQGYRKLLYKHGFMRMFHALLRKERVIARLLAGPAGERCVTNLLQLAELAQVASAQHAGSEKLLRWLADARASADGNVDEQQLRMESDEDLVQIVTIHKSKGLEYDVVFLPFIWASKESGKEPHILKYHDEDNRQLCANLDLQNRDLGLSLARKERLAEDLRLLYVAMTRAKYRCYFSWGQINGAADSAMAYLLHQDEGDTAEPVCNMRSLDDTAILRDLQRLNVNGNTLLAIESLPSCTELFSAQEQQTTKSRAQIFKGNASQAWHMTSFSGLTADSTHGRERSLELPDHDQEMADNIQPVAYDEFLSPFTFARGARAGLFLHYLLENLSFPETNSEYLANHVIQAMAQYGFDEKWQATVITWLNAIMDTHLDNAGTLCLRAIPDRQRLVELEFYFAIARIDVKTINSLLNEYRGTGRQFAALNFASISGMMKGFIDLIIEHDGRFYVLDYKSNHLGNCFTDYQTTALNQAIDNHYYDLQYLIYTLALHRYLKQRLADYSYEQHFGGVYYLFLRGMSPDNGNRSGVYFARPSLSLIENLDQCFGSTQEMQGA